MNTDLQPVGIRPAPVTPPPTGPQPARVTPPEASGTDVASPKISSAQSRANIQEAVERLNRQMQDTGRNLNFAIDQAADRVVITVRNTNTGEVVRQIPDESLLRVAHNIEDIKGLLHNATT